MRVVRYLTLLFRGLGVLALLVVAYWCIFPASLSALLEEEKAEAAPAAVIQAPKKAAPARPAAVVVPEAVANAAAIRMAAPARATRSQVAVAQWLGAKYRVSPAAIQILVVEADLLAKQHRFSPNLLMAIMAIESNFHPYIQSEAGAQGLMQVMPAIHAKRYEKFGGKAAMFDPVVSLKVGAEILRDFSKMKGGSETEALRSYFGGGATSDAYIEKVRAEQALLNRVAAGANVPVK